MSLTPADISGASFRTVRKGYDAIEVDDFLLEAAEALEDAQQHANAMEARARAAVARLQEATDGRDEHDDDHDDAEVRVADIEAETISRTLLLAQRTADATLAEATSDAERILREANDEAESTTASTTAKAEQMLIEARAKAEAAYEDARQTAESEVEALVARREFLAGDVDQLDRFLVDQRERLRAAARQIEELCDRVPAGLGSIRPPVVASDEELDDATTEMTRPDESDDLLDADDDAGGDDIQANRPVGWAGRDGDLDDDDLDDDRDHDGDRDDDRDDDVSSASA